MKNLRKPLSFILALLMLSGMLAVSAGAATLTIINEVTVNDVVAPVTDAYPSFDLTTDDRVEIEQIYWLYNGESLDSYSAFIDGEEYELDVILSAKSGYYFAVDDTYMSAVTVNIDGSRTEVMGYEGNPEAKIIVRTYFTASTASNVDPSGGAEPASIIENIDFTLTQEPTPGLAAEAHVSTDDPVEVVRAYWWNYTDDCQAEEFEEGKRYELNIIVAPIDGYDFSKDDEGFTNVNASVNGNGDDIYTSQEPVANLLHIYAYFDLTPQPPTDTTPIETSTDNPEPTETTPVATDTTPEPTETTPVPTDTNPEPTETTPVPTDTTPEPTETTPVATDTTPEPTDTTPVATDTNPEPSDTTPQPVNTDPTATEPVTRVPEPTQAPTSKPTEAQPSDTSSDKPETPLSPNADIKEAEKAIKNSKTDDPAGTTFGVLRARALKSDKKSITLGWNKVKGAKKYIIYANACGIKNKYKKLKTLSSGKKSFTVKKLFGKKLKKGVYYKFLIVAVSGKKKVISTAKTIHVVTKGGKLGNFKTVTTAAKKNKLTIKKGKKFKLKAKAVPESKKRRVSVHRKIKYETTNAKIAKVSSKGVITAKKKGACYVYVYAQSGTYKKIKVTVK